MNSSQDYENYFQISCLLTESNKLLQDLFKKQWVQVNGRDWTDDTKSGEYFLNNTTGKRIFESMENFQKNLAREGDSSKWDIGFCYIVLSHLIFSNKAFVLKQIETIKDIRNLIAHRTNMIIIKQDFDKLWSRLTQSMILLGYEEKKLNKFKYELNNRNSNTEAQKNEQAEQLKQEANRFFAQNNFQKSIECYTKCLSINDLSDNEKSVLYSNRSFAFLKMYQKQKKRDMLFKAVADAEQACWFNPRWFKVYARLGQVYSELNEVEKSIENYEKALVLQPGDEDIKNCLAKAKNLNFEQTRMAHFDETSLPMTTEERLCETLEKLGDRFGGKVKESFYLEAVKNLESKDKNLKDVWRAHEYRDGSKKYQQNYEMAAKYYSKAAKNGNAEAMYNLALAHMRGHGVKVDYNLAIGLLKQAASQPIKRKIDNFEFPNVGVAEAEHSLGLAYTAGMYVTQSDSLAAHWYQRAVDHEYGPSANNLGLMYLRGLGVDVDLDRAESLLLYAHRKGSIDAVSNLVDLYLRKMDPDKALMWHKRSIESGSLLDISRNESILKVVEEQKKMLNQINQELKKENFTQEISSRDEFDKLLLKKYPQLKNLTIQKLNTNSLNNSVNMNKEKYDAQMLYGYFKKGSKTAEIMLKAIVLFDESIDEFESCQNNDKQFENIVSKMSKAFQTCSLVCQMPIDLMDPLTLAIEKILNKNQTNDLDFDARICYIHLKMSDLQGVIKIIDESIQRYPNFNLFYYMRGCAYCFLGKTKKGAKDFDYVVRKEPNNYDALHSKLSALRIEGSYSESIECSKKYLEICPRDDRKVPETYYSIGVSELFKTEKRSESEKIKIVDKYLSLGLEAEKLQLPCFLPYDNNLKSILQDFSFAFGYKENKSESILKVVEDKPVRDDYRIQRIKEHRLMFSKLKQIEEPKKNQFSIQFSIKPLKAQKMPHNLAGLKNIYLKQIDFNKDHILDGYILNLRVIDVPLFMTSVQFIVEDDNKNVERMCVYNLGNEDKNRIKQDFKIGTQLSIVNPYIRLSMDDSTTIRVDDPSSIIFSGGCLNKMCRYCGKEESKFSCSKCKEAFYCSRECQIQDWKELDHKFVCI